MVEVRFRGTIEGEERSTIPYIVDTPWTGKEYTIRKLSWGKPVEYRTRRRGFKDSLTEAWRLYDSQPDAIPLAYVLVRRFSFPQFFSGDLVTEFGITPSQVLQEHHIGVKFVGRLSTDAALARIGLTRKDIEERTEEDILAQLAVGREDIDSVKRETLDELLGAWTATQSRDAFKRLGHSKVDVVLLDYPEPPVIAAPADDLFRTLMRKRNYTFSRITFGGTEEEAEAGTAMAGWLVLKPKLRMWIGLPELIMKFQEDAALYEVPERLTREALFAEYYLVALQTNALDLTKDAKEFFERLGISREEYIKRIFTRELTPMTIEGRPFKPLREEEVRWLRHDLRTAMRVIRFRLRKGQIKPVERGEGEGTE